EKFGTPIYLFNVSRLKRNFQDYVELAGSPANIVYPVKANPSLAVLRQICEMGGSVDCAAVSEIRLSLLARFQPSNILNNSPDPDMPQAVNLLQKGATVVADSAEMLRSLEAVYTSSPFPGKIFVRINPSIPARYEKEKDYHTITAHSSNTNKFGIPAEDLPGILSRTRVPVSGLHTHVGTQMDNVNAFVQIVRSMHEILDAIHTRTEHRIEVLDLGGGLGIPLTQPDCFPSIAELRLALRPEFREGIRYLVEPGQSLIGDAMGILTKVSVLKNIRGRNWAIMNVGSDQLSRITLFQLHHQILNEDHSHLSTEGPDSIAGPLCFSGDVLLPNTTLGAIKAGDYLFIQRCGAYCYAFSNRFNGRHYQGMLKICEDGSIVHCNTPESDALSPTFTTYNWDIDCPSWETPETIDLNIAKQLSSQYLKTMSTEEYFEILELKRTAFNTYEFLYDVHSPVDFVSGTLALRLMGDACITSALHAMGKDEKDIPVWTDHIWVHLNSAINPDHPLTCKIMLSPIASGRTAASKILLARYSLEDGKMTAECRIKFTLPEVPTDHPAAIAIAQKELALTGDKA
ncbi:MAG: hypothetical protein HOC20_06655, partial [Chloroflexi bacterium]|nr:hypothetical protein [Chloroflexota bacterium]